MRPPTEIFHTRALQTRLIIIASLICFGLAIAWVKSGTLQLARGSALKYLSEKQYLRSATYNAARGNIYDREGKLLSTSVPVDSIYAEPKKINNPLYVSRQIHKAAPEISQKALEKLSSDRSFAWIARRVDPNISAKIKAHSLEGIGFAKEERRFYPNHALLGQTLGLISIDGKAVSGIERAFDDFLRPKSYMTPSFIDARGNLLRAFVGPETSHLRGNDLYLTIDRDIQHVAEEALLRAVKKHRAKGGWAIVLRPKTGEILALANVPLLNPNYPMNAEAAKRNNAISRTGEPGSTFKIMTFAAAFDANVISPDEKIFCENGVWNLGYMTIKDISKKEWLTPAEIFNYSSNIGTYKIAQRVGKQKLHDIIRLFGFGQLPGIHLMEETKGYVQDYKKWGNARFANVSFGYGIMANSLQLALATATIANGGVKIAPKLLLAIKNTHGQNILPKTASERTQVISSIAAQKMTLLMIDETQKGTGKQASIPGILVAGKTGTAEKIDPQTGRYGKHLNVSSFVGFAPADNPDIAALVAIDEPQGIAYGGAVAAPAWREIVMAALIKQGLISQNLDDTLPIKKMQKKI